MNDELQIKKYELKKNGAFQIKILLLRLKNNIKKSKK